MIDSTDALQGYVPRLARHEDFDRIFEGVGSSSAESVHACDWSFQTHILNSMVPNLLSSLRLRSLSSSSRSKNFLYFSNVDFHATTCCYGGLLHYVQQNLHILSKLQGREMSSIMPMLLM